MINSPGEIPYDLWPKCPVPDCTKRACLALQTPYCFDHAPGSKHVKLWKIDASKPPLNG